MVSVISKSISSNLISFDNLFIEMTPKSCNKRCKYCYIDFPQFKKEEEFINIEIIEKALNDTKDKNIKCIYLTGAEPMGHPDFNSILRLCQKYSNVCICTNGSYINEKKARFLKKVEGEGNYEIIFKISLDHYDEIKNDEIRYRGAYRDAVFAIKYLTKYNFTPIITATNYYNEDPNLLCEKFQEIFLEYGIKTNKSHIYINPCVKQNSKEFIEDKNISLSNLDCQYGRVLSKNGIFSCPFLSNDFRGRCGSDFQNFSTSTPLETNFCASCITTQHELFGIDFSKFE